MIDIDMQKLDSNCFHGAYRDICELLGQKAALALHEHYAGQLVSFPKKLLADSFVHEAIYREYNGTNALELAKKYGYTVSWVRKVVKSKKIEGREIYSLLQNEERVSSGTFIADDSDESA